MRINANSDSLHLVLPRVVANEERPDPTLWSESRLAFQRLPQSSADKALVTAAATENTPDSQHDHEPIELLIGRSQRLLSEGDVEAARILLQRAAEAHDARAALALGATYDPIMLAILHTHGVTADVSAALDWYAKASKFGSQEAQERFRLLATVLVEPERRITRTPIQVAVSHEAVPRAAAPTHNRNGVGAAGIRVGAISDRSVRPQLVRDDVSQKLPALFGTSY
jgi:hypothetical protein